MEERKGKREREMERDVSRFNIMTCVTIVII